MKNLRFRQTLRNSYVLLIIGFLLSCNPKKHVDIQGHRGCRGLLPENSLPAFEKAIDLGVHTLELDIAITKDEKVVVSHEPFMSRTICYDPEGNNIPEEMDMAYNLFEMTHDEIKQFDCGSKFHSKFSKQEKLKTYKPLLSEVFELVKAKSSKVKFNIEIKSKPRYYGIYTPQPKDYVKTVIDEIIDHKMFEFVNLQSFDLNILEEIKKQSPNMPVALLIDEDESISTKLSQLSYKPEIISPYFKLLSQEESQKFQSEGYLIIPWTVNESEDMKTMLNWEVDGIITDYPDRLIALLTN